MKQTELEKRIGSPDFEERVNRAAEAAIHAMDQVIRLEERQYPSGIIPSYTSMWAVSSNEYA